MGLTLPLHSVLSNLMSAQTARYRFSVFLERPGVNACQAASALALDLCVTRPFGNEKRPRKFVVRLLQQARIWKAVREGCASSVRDAVFS